MATRSRSERDEGSSCFFFGVLGIVDNVEYTKNERSSLSGINTYLYRTASSVTIKRPVIIKVEGDKAKYRNVEKNLPSRYQTTVQIQPLSPGNGHWKRQ